MAENESVKATKSEKSASDKKAEKKSADKKPGFFSKLGKFFKGCWSELKKITWLSRPNTVRYTVFVIIAIVVIAAVIGAFDYLCAWVINILGQLV